MTVRPACARCATIPRRRGGTLAVTTDTSVETRRSGTGIPYNRVAVTWEKRASAGATAQANGVADRVRVVRDDGLSLRADASASFIALNPPFHTGATVHTGLAGRLFAEAARVLEPGGELWTVWNSHLAYRSQLERIVGPTRQVARGAKFTVTVSTRR